MHAIYGGTVARHKPPFLFERYNMLKVVIFIQHVGALAVHVG